MKTANSLNDVKIGDKLMPIGLWNDTERPDRRLSVPTEVLGVVHGAKCETGTMFKVRLLGGDEVWLSAGWFL